MRASERYRQRAQDVAKFRRAYLELMAIMEESRAGFVPEAGQEEEAARRASRVALAAGRANVAAADHEPYIRLEAPGIRPQTMAVILNWRRSLEAPRLVPPQDVLNATEQVIGLLEGKADQAAAVENTFVGRIAAFVGLPFRVRAAVAQEHPSFGRFAFASGCLVQVLIAGIGGVLTVVLIAAGARVFGTSDTSAPTGDPSPQPTVSAPPTTTPATSPTVNVPPRSPAVPTEVAPSRT